MKRIIILVAVIFAALPGQATAHSLQAMERALSAREEFVQIVNQPAPDFSLRDGGGAEVRLSDFRGKVVVLWFVYAQCPDVCPLHSEALASVQERVNRTPMRDAVQFISITTDPEHDTPAVLSDYGPYHGLDRINWGMLTSGVERASETRELAERYGLKFTATGDGYQMHGVVTHLIDKNGNLRARYHGLRFNPINLIVHINALTNDYH